MSSNGITEYVVFVTGSLHVASRFPGSPLWRQAPVPSFFPLPKSIPCVARPRFISSLMSCWTCGSFPPHAMINGAAVNTHVQVCVWTYVFCFTRHVPRSGMPGSHGDSELNFSRHCQPVFQSGYPILRAHQRRGKVRISPRFILYIS